MTNLLEIKNNVFSIAESDLDKKLTKKTVLNEVSKIRVDHSISISEQDLKIKLQLIFEECQDLTNNQFMQNCVILTKKDLFGKIPPAFKFKNPLDRNDDYDPFMAEIKFQLEKRNNGGSNGK